MSRFRIASLSDKKNSFVISRPTQIYALIKTIKVSREP